MILNKTKKTKLCQKTKILSSILSKAIGLMFSREIKDTGYVFVFNNPIRIDLHMMFVFYPIDLIFLDESKKVIEIKEQFKPFTLYYSKEKAKYVIELPKNTIKNSKTELNDVLEF